MLKRLNSNNDKQCNLDIDIFLDNHDTILRKLWKGLYREKTKFRFYFTNNISRV
ncbi:hypothetical protein GCM10008013_10710 [Paenibacillus segetis]|uniref:Uncharacterized protein n=1 Tax=Paenibacillus segetis TaxID=1325360 RepID=A0ABQ1Y7Z8_9BACL|nr:hypothetical protein GCM10008013_10710 [Paenibacillus segetis]